MSKYNIGDKVIRMETEKHGIILEVMPARRGRQLYKVNWGGIVSDELEVNLMPDCDISDPYERCMAGIFGSFSEYAKKNTSFKIGSSNNSTVSSLKASKTLFRAYQFKPLLKFLNSPNHRLLIADEVGLGKTIEAGHIMLELKARRELNHVLVVCPKSLQQKWRDELLYKFGLNFKIYESQKDLVSDMQGHSTIIRAIVNYEKIRLPRENKENKSTNANKSVNIIDFLSQNDFKFSLVLCDEAHKMRNRNKTFKGAEILMSMTNAAVFLTATPVMISTENLYNLLHLLDNSRYYNYQIFDNRLEENRPFVEALINLNHQQPLLKIAQNLDNAEICTRFFSDEVEIYSKNTTIGKAFSEDPIYIEIQRLLKEEDTTKNRARLQFLISSMSVMNSIFSRTRKREVTTDLSQAVRKPHMRMVDLSRTERMAFDFVINEYYDDNSYIDDWGEEKLTQGGSLGLVQKKRQVASSVFAYLNTEDSLDKGIDKYENYPDAKFEELLRIIDEVFKHGTKKIVIFALFRKTLKYLRIRFSKRGFGTLMIHGMVENRDQILHEFKHNPDANILLSSEVGSEGLDMQFCNSMVNYDLPWNPMVVEQRIGRIDRFGQKSPTVNIYNIIVKDSIQEDIYIRLLDRIGIFRGTIGDMEAILDSEVESSGKKITIQELYNRLEKELFTSKLTDEERQQKIAEIELAVAHERENIKHLEEGLDNALTNDAYFREEIRRIQDNNAYVTDVELRNYLESVIREKLTTCSLVEIKKDIYEFQIPISNPKTLLNFLEAYQPINEEATLAFRRFKKEIEGKSSILLTFNQERAYEDNSLLFLNIYHPIIQACYVYFSTKDDHAKTSFCYALNSDELFEKGEAYYMIIYQIQVNRKVQGVIKHSDTLLPLLYSIKSNSVVTEEKRVDRLFSRSQTSGIEHNPSNEDIDQDMLQDMRYDFADALNEVKSQKLSELKLQIESDRQRNEKQTIEYYKTMIENQQRFVSNWEFDIEANFNNYDDKRIRQLQGAIRLAKARITSLENEREERLLKIRDDSFLEINESVLSLNLINIV